MLRVNKVSYYKNYALYVELTNGLKGYFDLSPYLDKGIFVKLKNIDYLKMVKRNTCGIYWPKGQDFSADTIEHEMQQELHDDG